MTKVKKIQEENTVAPVEEVMEKTIDKKEEKPQQELLYNLKIEIRPIPGRDKIREFSENLEYFSQTHTVIPYINRQTRQYETGLTQKDIEYLQSVGFNEDLSMGRRIGGEPHPLWDSPDVKVDLLNSPIFLYPYRYPLDYIKWKFLLQSEFVYGSESEMESGTKPQATHYIYDESEEVLAKATQLERQNRLRKYFLDLTVSQKRKVLYLTTGEYMENKTEDYMLVKLEEVLKGSSKLALLESFSNMSSESIDTRVYVSRAILTGVIAKKTNGLYFHTVNLGFKEAQAVEFFESPENQDMLIALINSVKK